MGKNRNYFCSLLSRKLHKYKRWRRTDPDHNLSQICHCLQTKSHLQNQRPCAGSTDQGSVLMLFQEKKEEETLLCAGRNSRRQQSRSRCAWGHQLLPELEKLPSDSFIQSQPPPSPFLHVHIPMYSSLWAAPKGCAEVFLCNCAAPTLLLHSHSPACASTSIGMEPWQGRSVCRTHGQRALLWNSLKAQQQKTPATIPKTTKSSIWEAWSHYAYLCLFVLVLCYTGRWSLVGRADFCQTKEASFATTPTAPSPGALFSSLISRESHHTDFLNSSPPDGFCSAPHQ